MLSNLAEMIGHKRRSDYHDPLPRKLGEDVRSLRGEGGGSGAAGVAFA